MATPSRGSSSTYSNQHSNRPYNSSRGRGQNRGRGHGRGNRGYRGFTHTARSNENTPDRGNNQHGDMKTGLFKDSFLEDPWKDLIHGKQKGGRQSADVKSQPQLNNEGDGVMVSDDEGEIILSDDDDDFHESKGSMVGLGDGIVEAARKVS
jgi:hypothetical protein